MNPNLHSSQFYHGTSFKGMAGIINDGPRASRSGVLGPGFYATPSSSLARIYASSESDPSIVRGSITPSNPAHFDSEEHYIRSAGDHFDEAWDRAEEEGDEDTLEYMQSPGFDHTDYFNRHLGSLGHDAVRAGSDIINLFDPKHFESNAFMEGIEGNDWTDL